MHLGSVQIVHIVPTCRDNNKLKVWARPLEYHSKKDGTKLFTARKVCSPTSEASMRKK